jgi:hypothetical protein
MIVLAGSKKADEVIFETLMQILIEKNYKSHVFSPPGRTIDKIIISPMALSGCV